MQPFDKSDLRQGDCLLYFKNSIFDWIIALKCWTKVAHVEIYSGGGFSLASRNGVGVNRYPVRLDGLAVVRRPIGQIDFDGAALWFENVARGQPYDWRGLLAFSMAVKHGGAKAMFCSEFATRFYRHAKLRPFDESWDADRTPPSFFLVSPAFETVWSGGATH